MTVAEILGSMAKTDSFVLNNGYYEFILPSAVSTEDFRLSEWLQPARTVYDLDKNLVKNSTVGNNHRA